MPNMFQKNVSCQCYLNALSKCCLNVVSGDNIQTTLAASCKHIQDRSQKLFLANVVLSECCLNVVSGDNIQTTLGRRQRCKHIQDFKKKILQMLSECCLWRQHSDNFGCEVQTCPRFSNKMQMLSETLRQH